MNQEIIPWVALQRAGKVMQQAMQHLDAGREPAALRLLLEAREALQRYGVGSGVKEAVESLTQIIQRIERGEWDLRARKSSRYLSSSLRKMSSSDHWSAGEAAPSFKQPPPPPPTPEPPATPPATEPK